MPVRVRSFVGLAPLLAVTVTPEWVDQLDSYVQRRGWLEAHRQDLLEDRVTVHPDEGHQGGMALVPPDRYARVLLRVLDTAEFLSPYGIRSLSAAHRDTTTVRVGEQELSLRYAPGESDSGLFGGNSNWRGPVWLPVNVLLIEARRTYSPCAGDGIEVELPTGSGNRMGPYDAADDLSERLIGLSPRGRTVAAPASLTTTPTTLSGTPIDVQRVLSRRHRRGARRLPPDRLDVARRAPDLYAQSHGPVRRRPSSYPPPV